MSPKAFPGPTHIGADDNGEKPDESRFESCPLASSDRIAYMMDEKIVIPQSLFESGITIEEFVKLVRFRKVLARRRNEDRPNLPRAACPVPGCPYTADTPHQDEL